MQSEEGRVKSLKGECNAQVTKWVYSTKEIWTWWPDREDIMHPESVLPGPEGAFYAWGYDSANRIVVIHH